MLGKRGTAAMPSTHDRLALLKHVRDDPSPGQTQESSLQQLKEKQHVSHQLCTASTGSPRA